MLLSLFVLRLLLITEICIGFLATCGLSVDLRRWFLRASLVASMILGGCQLLLLLRLCLALGLLLSDDWRGRLDQLWQLESGALHLGSLERA